MMPTDQPSGSIHALRIHLPSINIAIPGDPVEQARGTAPCYPPLLRPPTLPWDRGRPARLWTKRGRDARAVPVKGGGLVWEPMNRSRPAPAIHDSVKRVISCSA